MRSKQLLISVVGAGLILAGCGGGGSKQAEPKAAPRATVAPTTTTTVASGPSLDGLDDIEFTEPTRKLSAWEQATDLGPDGEVTKDVALQAFSVAFGPLPGVTRPTGASHEASGTAALWWITKHADELTDAQLAAVDKAVGASVARTSAAAEPRIQLMAARPSLFDSEYPCAPVKSATEAVDEDGPGGAQYRGLVQGELAKVEGALGESLGIPIYVTVGDNPNPASEALAYTVPQSPDCTADPATSCRVHLYKNRLADAAATHRTIAHELVHCFQTHWMAPYDATDQAPWLLEGFPEYVGTKLHPEGDHTNFELYFLKPSEPLFARDYEAVGFYFHLGRTGGNPLRDYKAAFAKRDGPAAFADLISGATSNFEDTWASAITLEPERGSAWNMLDAPDSAHAYLGKATLVDGGRILLDSQIASARVGHVDFNSEVVIFNAGGGNHGRISWDGGDDTTLTGLSTTEYCARGGGCECPPGTTGTPPQTQIPSESAMVSAVGTTDATTLEIAGLSLDAYCKEKPKEPEKPKGVDPCVVGTWESNEFTMPGPISDLDGAGGAGARVRVSASGRVEFDFGNMDPIVVTDEQIKVTTEMRSRGKASGHITAGNGRWVFKDKNLDDLEGSMHDNIIGDMNLKAGPGLYVMLGDGTYSCSGSNLTYSSVDPVENQPVTVIMSKQ